MSGTDLKPCPFCGGEPRTMFYDGTMQATCAAHHTDCAGTDVLAPIRMWNTRAVDPAAIREAALREAAEVCTYVIKNIDILKADGETYETPRVQKIARGLVDVARQDILALIDKEKKA